jgi:hypothetical protein
MGFWSNLRAEFATGSASHHIDKWMKAALAAGDAAPTGLDTRKLGEALVVQLRANLPAIQQSNATPKPMLLAAAALAYGIRQCDTQGKRAMSDRLLPSLRIGLTHEVCKLDITTFTALDSELFQLAGSVFDASEPDTSGLSEALREIIEPRGEPKAPAFTPAQPGEEPIPIWTAQFADKSFRFGRHIPWPAGQKPVAAFQIGTLYVAVYQDPPGGSVPRCAATVYDTEAQRLLRVFALQGDFDRSTFLSINEWTGEESCTRYFPDDRDAFVREVIDNTCRAAGVLRTDVKRADL